MDDLTHLLTIVLGVVGIGFIVGLYFAYQIISKTIDNNNSQLRVYREKFSDVQRELYSERQKFAVEIDAQRRMYKALSKAQEPMLAERYKLEAEFAEALAYTRQMEADIDFLFMWLTQTQNYYDALARGDRNTMEKTDIWLNENKFGFDKIYETYRSKPDANWPAQGKADEASPSQLPAGGSPDAGL